MVGEGIEVGDSVIVFSHVRPQEPNYDLERRPSLQPALEGSAERSLRHIEHEGRRAVVRTWLMIGRWIKGVRELERQAWVNDCL